MTDNGGTIIDNIFLMRHPFRVPLTDVKRIHRELDENEHRKLTLCNFAKNLLPEKGPVDITQLTIDGINRIVYVTGVHPSEVIRSLVSKMKIETDSDGNPRGLDEVQVEAFNLVHYVELDSENPNVLRSTLTGDKIGECEDKDSFETEHPEWVPLLAQCFSQNVEAGDVCGFSQGEGELFFTSQFMMNSFNTDTQFLPDGYPIEAVSLVLDERGNVRGVAFNRHRILNQGWSDVKLWVVHAWDPRQDSSMPNRHFVMVDPETNGTIVESFMPPSKQVFPLHLFPRFVTMFIDNMFPEYVNFKGEPNDKFNDC